MLDTRSHRFWYGIEKFKIKNIYGDVSTKFPGNSHDWIVGNIVLHFTFYVKSVCGVSLWYAMVYAMVPYRRSNMIPVWYGTIPNFVTRNHILYSCFHPLSIELF